MNTILLYILIQLMQLYCFIQKVKNTPILPQRLLRDEKKEALDLIRCEEKVKRIIDTCNFYEELDATKNCVYTLQRRFPNSNQITDLLLHKISNRRPTLEQKFL